MRQNRNSKFESLIALEPLINFNRHVIPGSTLLEMLADFDTVDSFIHRTYVLLQIVLEQRGTLNQDRSTYCIEYQCEDAQKTSMPFVSAQYIMP